MTPGGPDSGQPTLYYPPNWEERALTIRNEYLLNAESANEMRVIQ
jgi:hypothetical protein